MLRILSQIHCKYKNFCRKIITSTIRTNKRKRKVRKHRYNEVRQLPTSSEQKGREILFKSINSGYNQEGQYLSLYKQRTYEEKKTNCSEFGSETNSESDLKITQNTSLSVARRACRQTAQHPTLKLPLSTAMGACRQSV